MRSDDLYRFSRGPHIPYGQSTIRMTANKLFSFMMPSHRVNSLHRVNNSIIILVTNGLAIDFNKFLYFPS